jgi:hypothetical protein
MLGASGSWTQSWSITPVTDANALRRLRAVYNFAIDDDPDKLRENYNLNVIAGNTNLVIDASRLLEPQCVICLGINEVRSAQAEKTTKEVIKLLQPADNTVSPADRTAYNTVVKKALQQQIAAGFAQTNNNYTLIVFDKNRFNANPNSKLDKRWLYWTDDSTPSPSEHTARTSPPLPLYPDPKKCPKRPEDCKPHSLGHYGNHELLMTEADYRSGVLGDFLLFLLPQADPRLPAPPTSGGSPGGGGSGGSKSGSG